MPILSLLRRDIKSSATSAANRYFRNGRSKTKNVTDALPSSLSQVTTYDAAESSTILSQIMIFGEQLLALKEDGTGLIVWSIETGGEAYFKASPQSIPGTH